MPLTGRHQGGRKGPFGQPARHQEGRKGLIGQPWQEWNHWTPREAPRRHQGSRKEPFGQPGRHQGGRKELIGKPAGPGRLLCYRCSERPLKAILCYEGHRKRIPCYERPVEEESVLRCPFSKKILCYKGQREAPRATARAQERILCYESPKKRLLCEESL